MGPDAGVISAEGACPTKPDRGRFNPAAHKRRKRRASEEFGRRRFVRHGSARVRLPDLDTERTPPPRGHASSRREGDHRARRADARGRMAGPRAQHREGARPEGALARGHPHLSRPPRRRRKPRREGLQLLPRRPGARDERRLLREERALRRRRVPPDPAPRAHGTRRARSFSTDFTPSFFGTLACSSGSARPTPGTCRPARRRGGAWSSPRSPADRESGSRLPAVELVVPL